MDRGLSFTGLRALPRVVCNLGVASQHPVLGARGGLRSCLSDLLGGAHGDEGGLGPR